MSDSTGDKLDQILARQREKLGAEQIKKQEEAAKKAAADKVRGEGRAAWNDIRVFVNEEVDALNEKLVSDSVFLRKEFKGTQGADHVDSSVTIKVEAPLAKDLWIKIELLASGRFRVTDPSGWEQNKKVLAPSEVTREYIAQALVELLDKSI